MLGFWPWPPKLRPRVTAKALGARRGRVKSRPPFGSGLRGHAWTLRKKLLRPAIFKGHTLCPGRSTRHPVTLETAAPGDWKSRGQVQGQPRTGRFAPSHPCPRGYNEAGRAAGPRGSSRGGGGHAATGSWGGLGRGQLSSFSPFCPWSKSLSCAGRAAPISRCFNSKRGNRDSRGVTGAPMMQPDSDHCSPSKGEAQSRAARSPPQPPASST